MRVSLVDLGVSNLTSIRSALEEAGFSVGVHSRFPGIAALGEAIVLPGVGSFTVGMRTLVHLGWADQLQMLSASRPVLGICLGAQLLLDRSEEHGAHNGLGITPGSVVPVADRSQSNKASYKNRLNTGWRFLKETDSAPDWVVQSLSRTGRPAFFFNHSFYCKTAAQNQAAVCDDSRDVVAIFNHGLGTGFQFHPELSGGPGIDLLRNWGRRL